MTHPITCLGLTAALVLTIPAAASDPAPVQPGERAVDRSSPSPRGVAIERFVQIRSIDFDNGIIELFNFAGTDIDLSRWRFCSHDFNEARRYSGTNGLNGVTIEAGSSVYIHFNNDAPGGNPDRIDRAALGGSFAAPLDQDAYGLQIFFPDANGNISFGNSSLIGDHVQWNENGASAGSAETRTGQAVGQGLWSANGDFVPTTDDTTSIVLNDLSGDVAGSPSEYDVLAGPQPCNDADLVAPFGDLNVFDILAFLDAWGAQQPAGDFNTDGQFTVFDILDFLAVWNAGCP